MVFRLKQDIILSKYSIYFIESNEDFNDSKFYTLNILEKVFKTCLFLWALEINK